MSRVTWFFSSCCAFGNVDLVNRTRLDATFPTSRYGGLMCPVPCLLDDRRWPSLPLEWVQNTKRWMRWDEMRWATSLYCVTRTSPYFFFILLLWIDSPCYHCLQRVFTFVFKKKKRERERKPAVVVPIVRPMSPNGGWAHSGRVFNFEIRSLGKKK